MRHTITPWPRRALTPDERAEIAAHPSPARATFYGVRPPMPAGLGRPARPGWYRVVVTLDGVDVIVEGASPIGAWREAVRVAEEAAA